MQPNIKKAGSHYKYGELQYQPKRELILFNFKLLHLWENCKYGSDIEKMPNAFRWCGGSNRKGIRWMAWDKLSCSKKEGGLGLRDFRAFNMAMVAK